MTERESIIPQDVADDLREKYPTPLTPEEKEKTRKAKDAERKREDRRIAREQKTKEAAERKAAEAKSWPEYWQQQRQNLTEAQRAEYEARESDVLSTEWCMTEFLNGTYRAKSTDEEITLPQLIDEVQQEIKTYGVCESAVLVVPYLWSDEEKPLREAIARKSSATATLIRYGYRTALDGFLVEQFRQKFMVERSTPVPSFYTTLKCTACDSPTSVVAVSNEIARSYTEHNIKFECSSCRAKENAARAISKAAVGKETLYQKPDNHALFDSYGRIRDN